MGKEQWRLFGFELNFDEEHENCQGEAEEVNVSGKYSEKSLSRIGKTVKKQSVSRKLEERNYKCQFGLKKFTNSQALGGHQNAHKSERLKKRRMGLQPKGTNLRHFVDELPHDFNGVTQHRSLDQNQNLYCDMAEFYHFVPWPSHEPFQEGTWSRHMVIKPSPSYISKDCQSLYNQLGLAPPAIHGSSRNG